MNDLEWNLQKLRWHWNDPNYWTEKLIMAIVWRLPHDVIKWAAIRLMAHATSGQWGNQEVHSVNIMDALKRWDEKP